MSVASRFAKWLHRRLLHECEEHRVPLVDPFDVGAALCPACFQRDFGHSPWEVALGMIALAPPRVQERVWRGYANERVADRG